MSTHKSALKTITSKGKPKPKHINFDVPPRYKVNDRFVYLSNTAKCGRVISECAFVPREGRQYVVLFDGANSIECLREDYMSPEDTKITKHKASSIVRHSRKKGFFVPEDLFRFLSALTTALASKKEKRNASPLSGSEKTINDNSNSDRVTSLVAKAVAMGSSALKVTASHKSTRKNVPMRKDSNLKQKKKVCSRVGCTKEVYKKGLCKSHVAAQRKKHAFT